MIDQGALAKLIKESGISFRENARSYVFTCPRCEKKDRLSMYKETGWFICYHCASEGFKGRPEFALAELLGTQINEIRKRLYGTDAQTPSEGFLTVELVDHWGDEDNDDFVMEVEAPPREVCWSPDFVAADSTAFAKARAYLAGRGVTEEHISTYDLRWSPVDQRVIFPVKVGGKLVGWQARYIHPTSRWDEELERQIEVPKILTSDSLQKLGTPYLMFQDRLIGSEHCVLTEGPISAIKAHKCGGNVASMGKMVTAKQLQTIKKHCKKLYIALDPDAGEQITKMAYEMAPELEIYLLTPPQNEVSPDDPENDKDLGDMSEDAVHEVFLAAKPEPKGRLYVSLGSFLAT